MKNVIYSSANEFSLLIYQVYEACQEKPIGIAKKWLTPKINVRYDNMRYVFLSWMSRGLFSCNKCHAREKRTCLTWHAQNVKSSIINICNKRILERLKSYRMTGNVSWELNVLLPSESESESESTTTLGFAKETLCLPFGTWSIGKTCQDSYHKDVRKFCLWKPTSFKSKFIIYAHQKV